MTTVPLPNIVRNTTEKDVDLWAGIVAVHIGITSNQFLPAFDSCAILYTK